QRCALKDRLRRCHACTAEREDEGHDFGGKQNTAKKLQKRAVRRGGFGDAARANGKQKNESCKNPIADHRYQDGRIMRTKVLRDTILRRENGNREKCE